SANRSDSLPWTRISSPSTVCGTASFWSTFSVILEYGIATKALSCVLYLISLFIWRAVTMRLVPMSSPMVSFFVTSVRLILILLTRVLVLNRGSRVSKSLLQNFSVGGRRHAAFGGRFTDSLVGRR